MLDQYNRREDELLALLENPDYKHKHPHHPMHYQWWREYEASGNLPYHPTLAGNPLYWWDDVRFFRLTHEYEHTLPDDKRYIHKRIAELREQTQWS